MFSVLVSGNYQKTTLELGHNRIQQTTPKKGLRNPEKYAAIKWQNKRNKKDSAKTEALDSMEQEMTILWSV